MYADSQAPISADDFSFTRTTTYPSVLADFAAGFAALEQVRCDILITPHPDAAQLWERVAKRASGGADALIDPSACRRYASAARERLAQRVAKERAESGRE